MTGSPMALMESLTGAVTVECPHGIVDDVRLMAQVAGGDEAAFDRIVTVHRDRVAGLAYRLLGWSDDVDDVVQEVFLAAYIGLRRFRGDCSLTTWLATITVNKCRSHRRKRLLRWKRQTAATKRGPAAPADRRLMDHETNVRVRRAVAGLPARYREVVVLRYLEEMPIEQVAAVLRISRNAVQIRLHRARGRLEDALRGLVEE